MYVRELLLYDNEDRITTFIRSERPNNLPGQFNSHNLIFRGSGLL